MMNNIRSSYAEIHHKRYKEGVFPYKREWIVYIYKMLKGHKEPVIVADRKFKTHEGAEIYYNQLKIKLCKNTAL